MSGILAPPGNPAFLNVGRPWRDLPSSILPAGENRPASKPELKYLGGLSASHFLPKGRNCRADHKTKRIETLWPGTHVQKCILVTSFRAQ